MSHPQMPYQCMVTCGNVLVAARGSNIDSFNLENGSLLSTWTCPASQETQKQKPVVTETQKKEETPDISIPVEGENLEENGPPAKKRKLSTESAEVKIDETPIPKTNQKQQEGKKKQKQNSRSVPVASGLQAPAVIALASTKDGKHVIAVTGEDKSIRVFESIEDGGSHKLQHISERAMPKRPCSITISADDLTIISADKFGDVYSLPLLFTPLPISQFPPSTPQTPDSTTSKPYIPAANELTIHSQRNRKALENQKRQANRATEKAEPTFEYKLLLGHVSMLTDVALVAVQGRNYIVTADRDEHIRISRGIPQAHIIEGFCLGHTEFITRLCFAKSRREILISGGGEDELFIWEWLSGTLLSKANLKSHVDVLRSDLEVFKGHEATVEAAKIAVSGIFSAQVVAGSETEDIMIVTCEGVPALFTFALTSHNRLEHIQTLRLSGNALALVSNSSGLVVSVDTIHKEGSISELRNENPEDLTCLQSYKFEKEQLVPNGVAFAKGEESKETEAVGKLGNLLYGLENLRKREGDAGDE
ncbi:related to tRNA (guanine-N(7)-)-methyltransferase subunit trm82 [Rhynchosporium secalis]|uniref:Related to tRNA (Guanine-N(7)-)-methyltransferase subunit trm82 n=1 Tax=Rhynchosporium secalis TaxID=38038 RepID=A0A1E1MFU5_RHYSE|nr:related to tRNA (guanine-N(7)-)-methyltransferase subunit trm82 [Rhynchosporium secalis]